MAKEQNELQIIIEAVNRASKQLEKVKKDLSGLSNAAKKAGGESSASTSKFDKFKGAILKAGDAAGIARSGLVGFMSTIRTLAPELIILMLAIKAIVKVVQTLTGFVSEAIPAFQDYEKAMMGLSSTSAAFGVNQGEARDAAKSLASDGLISVSTAAAGLKSILSTGLGLEEATTLIETYKNNAAFGRSSTIEFDQAVRNLAESFKTENSAVGNLSGQAENYNYIIEVGAGILGKKTKELSKAEREQAKYLGTLEISMRTEGDAALYAETYAGKQAKLRQRSEELRVEMGSYLIPVMEALTEWKLRLMRHSESLTKIMRIVAKAFLLVAQGAVQAANSIKFTIAVIKGGLDSIATFSLDPLIEGFTTGAGEMLDTWEDFGSAWDKINDTTIGDIEKDMVDGLGNMVDGTDEAAKKMADAWEKYQHSVEKATQAYEQRLSDLVIAHRETWKQIKDDISDEEGAYEENLENLSEKFEKTMGDLQERHGEKTKSILKDIQEERDAMSDAVDDISEDWNSLIALTEEAGSIRLSNLQRQLDKEKSLGAGASQERIDALEEYIAREEEALSTATEQQKGKMNDEISEVELAAAKKIAELEAELATEKSAYQESVSEKELSYQEDVQNYTDSHDEKIQVLEEKLEEEERIRNEYADVFAEVGDKRAEDDITRLMNNHQRQLDEMEYQYQKTLEGIEGMESKKTGIVVAAEEKQQEAIEKTNEAFSKSINLLTEWNSLSSSMPEHSKPIGPKMHGTSLFPDWMQGYQHGGIVSTPSIVGEKNYPEAVLPLGEPKRVEQILKSLGLGGGDGKKVEQHFHMIVKRESDVDMIMEKAAFNMKYK